MLSTSAEPSNRRRPSWLGPLVVGLAALPIGAALAVGVDGQREASPDRSAPSLNTEVSSTIATSTAISTVVPDPSNGRVEASDDLVALDVSTSQGSGQVATVDVERPAAGSISVDGETFIETYQCMAFPTSNPVTGSGDAGIRLALHRLQSTTGRRIALERWRYDVGGGLGLSELNGRSSETELVEFPVAPVDATYDVRDDGAVRRVVLGELTEPSTMCAPLVIQAGDEFRTFGLVDVCFAPDGVDSDLVEVFTFHGGVAMTRRDAAVADRLDGELRHPAGVFTIVDGAIRSTDRGSIELSGSLHPGPLSSTDSFLLQLDSTPSSRTCLPEQLAAG